MEHRLSSSENKPTRSEDRDYILTRMFEEVCDLRESIKSGRPILPDALDLALLTVKLVSVCDQSLDSKEAKKDSLRVRDVSRDSVRDSSGKYAFKIGSKWILFGAELVTDFVITNENLEPKIPAILEAMKSLHIYNIRVGRIEAMNNRIRVFPDDGIRDPRSNEISLIV